jgi:hypothetical protein
MQLIEFTALLKDFQTLPQAEQIIHFGWFLHRYKKQESFDQAAIRACFKERHMAEPNTSLLFKRLADRRPKVVIQVGKALKLEAKTREDLDKKYGRHESTIVVSQMLTDLIGKLSDEAERHFLSEAIKCYHVRAARAAIIMAWNLTYDHLLKWILADAQRVTDFNAKIVQVIGPKLGGGLVISKREDFEALKEANVLDICSAAALFASANTKKILKIQLDKRNLAAHPSLVEIDPPQADDTISSLIKNVVLVLK